MITKFYYSSITELPKEAKVEKRTKFSSTNFLPRREPEGSPPGPALSLSKGLALSRAEGLKIDPVRSLGRKKFSKKFFASPLI